MQDDNRQVSGLSTEQELLDNLKMNCVPSEIMEISIDGLPRLFDFKTVIYGSKNSRSITTRFSLKQKNLKIYCVFKFDCVSLCQQYPFCIP